MKITWYPLANGINEGAKERLLEKPGVAARLPNNKASNHTTGSSRCRNNTIKPIIIKGTGYELRTSSAKNSGCLLTPGMYGSGIFL